MLLISVHREDPEIPFQIFHHFYHKIESNESHKDSKTQQITNAINIKMTLHEYNVTESD